MAREIHAFCPAIFGFDLLLLNQASVNVTLIDIEISFEFKNKLFRVEKYKNLKYI